MDELVEGKKLDLVLSVNDFWNHKDQSLEMGKGLPLFELQLS